MIQFGMMKLYFLECRDDWEIGGSRSPFTQGRSVVKRVKAQFAGVINNHEAATCA